MDPITPTCEEGHGVIFAKDQPQYLPLPAKVCTDGRVITEWQLTEEERRLIACGENIRLHLYTFGQPLQPVRLQVTTPEGD
jgi:hypothetical protein